MYECYIIGNITNSYVAGYTVLHSHTYNKKNASKLSTAAVISFTFNKFP